MAATIDNRVAELERANTQLRQQLDACSTELKEARDQQTATAEVLQVINSSPGDLAPVFDAMLEKALRLCDAALGVLFIRDGELFRAAVTLGLPAPLEDFLRNPFKPDQMALIAGVIQQGQVLHVHDAADTDGYHQRLASRVAGVELGGVRTVLYVPLTKDGRVLGVFVIFRQEVRPFSDKQIALLQNFAAQAVIAMENARLITETREALEQQTATAEVLQVINSSPGDLTPVFEAMLERAMRLCGAEFGEFFTADSEQLRAVALRGTPPAFAEFRRRNPAPPTPGSITARILAGEPVIHVADVRDDDLYRQGDPHRRALVDLGGARTFLSVTLLKDRVALGSINIYRQEVRPFSDSEIVLLQNFAAQAVIAMENARLLTETHEALEQQTATAEVLQVINSSPGDLAPVFDAILEKAHTLCGATHGHLTIHNGEHFRAVATHGVPEQFAELLRQPFHPGHDLAARLLGGEPIFHIPDMAALALRPEDQIGRAAVELGGARTLLAVPLRKDHALLGYITAHRQEVRPFSDKQIALLQNFAAQAVIAMENARLIAETREALEQQTATAEVLQVINSSPGDLAPVFDAMLEKALALCEAARGQLATFDGEFFEFVALKGDPRWVGHHPRGRLPSSRGITWPRLVDGEPFVHIADARETEIYRSGQEQSRDIAAIGGRTFLTVALRRENVLLGALTIYRQEVRPFSDKQIALLQNFAAQAVIAMENARLIAETREALEQQTATAEVLGVINSSPGDLAPVFDAMLEKAMRLCEAVCGHLYTYDGERFCPAAVRGERGFAEWWRRHGSVRPATGAGPLGRIVLGEPIVVTDYREDPAYSTIPEFKALVDAGGLRSGICVALRKDNSLLGTIHIYRQEVRPFTDKQVALLQNFAAQAVIAMENARLLTETREALEQQTATAEVLQVINSSPGELAPVFDAMLEKAMRLCAAPFGGLWTYDGEQVISQALRGVSAKMADFYSKPFRPAPVGWLASLITGAPFVHVSDILLDEGWADRPAVRALVELGNFRSTLMVPLRKEGAFIGVICIYGYEPRPFTDKQIALLQNFAAQAVIAMENARLLSETREALEQQTATAEVLQVINSSPGELAPVFDAMLGKATTLCEAVYGHLWTYDRQRFHPVAFHGEPGFGEYIYQRGAVLAVPDSPFERILKGERCIHIPDVLKDASYDASRGFREVINAGGIRTQLTVALSKDDVLLGLIVIYRQEVRPFSDKQIALLQNFAAQAVIAMENARLVNELRQRTHDLQESLEYQTATSDVLKVISQSTFDLEPVLQTVLDTAIRLCGNTQGLIFRREEDGVYRLAVSSGAEPEYLSREASQAIRPGPDTLVGRTVLAGRPVQIIDAMSDPDYALKEEARVGQLRTMLGVPLLREGVPIGVICTARTTVEPFTEKQIALVTTFADQAVIAIENARLFNELRQRTDELGRSVEELKMLGEVGRAVSSTLDLRTVLSTILNASLGVTWANAGAVFRYSRAERAFRLVEAVGWDEALARSVGEMRVAESESAMGQAIAARGPVALPDLAELPSTPLRDATLAAGFHSALIVPLVGAERIFGALVLQRREAGDFPAETVRLMQTLASQSVLTIQNARLFREIADKSEQLALASQHKSQFLANMSHELRTPLNAILGFAELLVDGIYGVLPEKAQGVLERVQNNGKHLLALINDVLDLAKIEAGQLALILEDYALAEVVRSVVSATEPLAAAKGLTFTAIVQEGMPRAHGDARRVSQVLLNLVGNAIKFTDAGEVEIGAAAEGRQFVLTVRDTGPGIADADQERIFGEFQQIENTDTRKKGGTGLGLAISKRMVEMQGGMISVDSALGRGSTFRVVLPVHVEPAMEEAAE